MTSAGLQAARFPRLRRLFGCVSDENIRAADSHF